MTGTTVIAPRSHGRPTWRDRAAPVVTAWRPLVAVAAAWLIVLVAAGLLLTGPLAGGAIVRTDLAIERWLAEHRTGVLDALAEGGTWLAETFVVPIVLVVAIVVAWRKSTNVAAPIFLAVAVGGEKFLYFVASVVVGRSRPPVPTVGATYATSSFPSGHVASVISLYGAIVLVATARRSQRARVASLIGVGVMTAAVALCRMYTGFHYLSDCVAGALTGVVWLTATYRLVFAPGEGERTPTVTAATMVRAPLPEVRDAHSEAAGVRTGGRTPGGVGSGTRIGDSDGSHPVGKRAHR